MNDVTPELFSYCANREYSNLRFTAAFGIRRALADDKDGNVVIIPADVYRGLVNE